MKSLTQRSFPPIPHHDAAEQENNGMWGEKSLKIKRAIEIYVIWMWWIFKEAVDGVGLESRLMWGPVSHGSRDKAVRPLLIKGLMEVGWHHDWARGTCSAVQRLRRSNHMWSRPHWMFWYRTLVQTVCSFYLRTATWKLDQIWLNLLQNRNRFS